MNRPLELNAETFGVEFQSRSSLHRNEQTMGLGSLNCKYLNLGFLSNQGEKSINFCFIMVPLRKKWYGTPSPETSLTYERERERQSALNVT